MKKIFWQMAEECRQWRSAYVFRRPLLLFLIGICVLLAALKKIGVLDTVAPLDPSRWSGRPLAITGIVVSHPDPRPKGCVTILRTETVDVFGAEGKELHAVSGDMLLHISEAPVEFAAPGDRLRAVGRLQPPRPSYVPGTFDYADYLKNHDI